MATMATTATTTATMATSMTTTTCATVVGHYWRRRHAAGAGDADDLWEGVPPFAWVGGVMCIDYSVGRRYVERHRGRQTDFSHGLAALRWPERTLVFDDRDDTTTTFGTAAVMGGDERSG
jgi:hypothetical protein